MHKKNMNLTVDDINDGSFCTAVRGNLMAKHM